MGRDVAQIDCHLFEERCQRDLQGVIRGLIDQTTRQGAVIHDLGAELAEVRNDAMTLGQQLAEAERHVRELEGEVAERRGELFWADRDGRRMAGD
jgi:hypothetical protein